MSDAKFSIRDKLDKGEKNVSRCHIQDSSYQS